MSDHVQKAFDYLEKIESGEAEGLSFGWGGAVDGVTMGLERENLVVVGGANKSGKTSFAVNTVSSCLADRRRVLVVTTEVSSTQYTLRLACREAGVTLREIRANSLDAEGIIYLHRALNALDHDRLRIFDRPRCHVDEIAAEVKTFEPDLVVVDHLQRLNLGSDNLALGIRDACQRLKNLAIRHDLPVMLLSQITHGEGWVSREDDGELRYNLNVMSTRYGKEPLGEGDKVIFLHNLGRDYWEPKFKDRANVIIHSQRDYESGDIIPVRVVLGHQWVGDEAGYLERYGNPKQELPSGVPGGGEGDQVLEEPWMVG